MYSESLQFDNQADVTSMIGTDAIQDAETNDSCYVARCVTALESALQTKQAAIRRKQDVIVGLLTFYSDIRTRCIVNVWESYQIAAERTERNSHIQALCS